MKSHRVLAVIGSLILSLTLLAVVTAAPEDTGGPDAFGYVYIDSNEPGGPVYDWVDISGTGTSVALDDDDSSAALPISYTFNFYGNDFTEFYINSNGFLSFGSGSTDFSSDCPLSASSPSNVVAIMWDDMDPGDSVALAYYESFEAGSCPYDSYPGECTVAQYQDYEHFPGPGIAAGTWEAIFFDNDSLVLQYADVGTEAGTNSTTGIGNGDGSINLTYGSCNTAGHLETDLAILFMALEADISVDPTSLASTQETDSVATVPISITNGGDLDLNWEILEQSAVNEPVDLPNAVPERLNLASTAPANHLPPSFLGDAVMDGSFETGSPNTYWAETSTNFGSPLCTVASCGTGSGTGPRTGSWWTWFGGIPAYEEGSVTQDVTIPSSASDLVFYLEQFVCDGPQDYMEVTIDGAQVFVTDGASPLCGVLGYSMQTVDISAYADDAVHTLAFHSEIFAQNLGGSNFFVDDVSIPFSEPGDCVPDAIPWASADPITGTTSAGATSVVDVSFDSTGLADGVYTGTMCILSNDVDTPELLVDLTMTVEHIPTGVALSSLTGDTPSATTGVWLLAATVTALAASLLLRRRYSRKEAV